MILNQQSNQIIMYANPSKFYILSLGFPDIEIKQGFENNCKKLIVIIYFHIFYLWYKNVKVLKTDNYIIIPIDVGPRIKTGLF